MVFSSRMLLVPHLLSFIQEPQNVPQNQHVLSWPLRASSWICTPQASLPPVQARDAHKGYEQTDHLKKCRSPPDQEKSRRECFGKCRPQTRCWGKCRTSASGLLACASFYRGADPEALFRHFPRHPVWGSHFPKHSLQHFSWSEFGTSLDGRPARKGGTRTPRT